MMQLVRLMQTTLLEIANMHTHWVVPRKFGKRQCAHLSLGLADTMYLTRDNQALAVVRPRVITIRQWFNLLAQ